MSFYLLSACQLTFNSIKNIVSKAPIFVDNKQGVKTTVKIDSSDFVSSEVFYQLGNNGLL